MISKTRYANRSESQRLNAHRLSRIWKFKRSAEKNNFYAINSKQRDTQAADENAASDAKNNLSKKAFEEGKMEAIEHVLQYSDIHLQ